jgi:hypothetical protein
MGKINGTILLLYADGQVIAAQRGGSVTVEQDLPDATSKDSGGWAEHINGLRNASGDFEALFSTTGLSASELKDAIFDRRSLLLAIVGLTYPIVGEVDLSSLKLNATQYSTMSLSGSWKAKGALFLLKGSSASLFSDPKDADNYDTLTAVDLALTSAINAAGSAFANSTEFAVTEDDVIKIPVFLTINAGEAPSMGIWNGAGSVYISNVVQLVAGLNIVTLTCTADFLTAVLRITNSAAADWSLSSIYATKYVET